MARLGSPGTVVITCPFPSRLGAVEAAGWLREGASAGGVTWVASLDTLLTIRDLCTAAGSSPDHVGMAIDLEPEWLTAKTSLRAALREARAMWPTLSAAVLRGPTPLEHREVLVQEGITTVRTDAFDEAARGSRRPAPRGWPCRSVLWGLWEVSVGPGRRQGLLGRVRWWCTGPTAAGLTILDAGGGASGQSAMRQRLDRHLAWARRRIQAGRLQPATLADLPAIIAGGGSAGVRGSILRAA